MSQWSYLNRLYIKFLLLFHNLHYFINSTIYQHTKNAEEDWKRDQLIYIQLLQFNKRFQIADVMFGFGAGGLKMDHYMIPVPGVGNSYIGVSAGAVNYPVYFRWDIPVKFIHWPRTPIHYTQDVHEQYSVIAREVITIFYHVLIFF